MKAIRKFKIRAAVRKQRFSLTVIFGVFVFATILAALIAAAGVLWIAKWTGMYDGVDDLNLWWITFFMGAVSLVIGAGLSLLLCMVPLKPINRFINHMNELAAGNFKIRLKFDKPFTNHPTFVEVSESFNKLAKELENTEILRGDFINNFSHEFKTPIVSIAGLAKVVKRGDITEEARREYLDAIEEESLRLASMATNIMKLSRVENQAILHDVCKFNLSEQIRSCILLLENKWSAKDIEFELDFDEHGIEAEEELLKEVWINLMDNAVKFSPEGGKISADIRDEGEKYLVSISNEGADIPADELAKIWGKFYQGDKSHSGGGNGVGLAIVKRIVELHGGSTWAQSKNGVITFFVELPK